MPHIKTEIKEIFVCKLVMPTMFHMLQVCILRKYLWGGSVHMTW
jgi:hypothetical protein